MTWYQFEYFYEYQQKTLKSSAQIGDRWPQPVPNRVRNFTKISAKMTVALGITCEL